MVLKARVLLLGGESDRVDPDGLLDLGAQEPDRSSLHVWELAFQVPPKAKVSLE